MKLKTSSFLAIFLVRLLCVSGYNNPSCAEWPSPDVWDSDLANQLSVGATLHGPLLNALNQYASDCETLGTDAYKISQGYGICMQAHACKYEFCQPSHQTENLPIYVADVRTVADIQAAISFANDHDIAVAVKTTGHSYTGSSSHKDSLLIWMQNYPKDGAISTNWTDSCGTTHEASVGVNGGETWNDVIEAVKGDYHVVTGGGRTVSAAGGWLQGGGLSFSSRLYGVGVDQALRFDLVLPNGTAVQADACTNTDLFWALRGGGGGTFGVVTHVDYMVHPVQSIVRMSWFIEGIDFLLMSGRAQELLDAIELYLRFWIDVSPKLDDRWSGFFGPTGLELNFFGSMEDARDTLINEMDNWYNTVLLPNTNFIPNVWGAFPPSATLSTFPDWYSYKGGAEAYNDPDQTDPTGDAYMFVPEIYSRLIPQSLVESKPEETLSVLMDLVQNAEMGAINYFLGGVVADVDANATAVHPALRMAIWSMIGSGTNARNKLIAFAPNTMTGVCFNHHSSTEPEWREACFGSNYDRLLDIKMQYDPKKRLNCWHCVGYQGDELPSLGSKADDRSNCPSDSMVAMPSQSPVDTTSGVESGSGALLLCFAILAAFVYC